MALPPRHLTANNIDEAIRDYRAAIAEIGQSVGSAQGVELFRLLKRGQAGTGPYPHVSLFEASNRIMTDLVILGAVKWLLAQQALPFHEYDVEYGHENNAAHDIMAGTTGHQLIGEAFNVAQSFFSIKKAATLRKLRASSVSAAYRFVACNADAVSSQYLPKPLPGEFILLVDIESGDSRVVPDNGLQPAAAGAILSPGS